MPHNHMAAIAHRAPQLSFALSLQGRFRHVSQAAARGHRLGLGGVRKGTRKQTTHASRNRRVLPLACPTQIQDPILYLSMCCLRCSPHGSHPRVRRSVRRDGGMVRSINLGIPINRQRDLTECTSALTYFYSSYAVDFLPY